MGLIRIRMEKRECLRPPVSIAPTHNRDGFRIPDEPIQPPSQQQEEDERCGEPPGEPQGFERYWVARFWLPKMLLRDKPGLVRSSSGEVAPASSRWAMLLANSPTSGPKPGFCHGP